MRGIVAFLSVAIVGAMLASDASAQCSRRGECSASAVDVQVYAQAAPVFKQVVETCAVPVVAVSNGCTGSMMAGPTLIEGRPLANIGRRFLYRLRHPFAPIVRRD